MDRLEAFAASAACVVGAVTCSDDGGPDTGIDPLQGQSGSGRGGSAGSAGTGTAGTGGMSMGGRGGMGASAGGSAGSPSGVGGVAGSGSAGTGGTGGAAGSAFAQANNQAASFAATELMLQGAPVSERIVIRAVTIRNMPPACGQGALGTGQCLSVADADLLEAWLDQGAVE